MMYRIYRVSVWCVLVLLSVTLMACGGGGGGNGTAQRGSVQAPNISYPNSPVVYTAGTAISANQPSNVGGPTTSYAVSNATPLPAGLTLDPQNGDITGTPTIVTGAKNYTVVATNSGGSASATLSITVKGTVGGTVSGLVGTGLTLQDNSGDDMTLSANGSFTFPTPISNGVNYAVTVSTPPSGHPVQTCMVSNGTGTMGSANVTTVLVVCTNWIWEAGSNTAGAIGVYPLNAPGIGTPGARYDASSWTDSSGHLWLFGGIGNDQTTSGGGDLNDLWVYDPNAKTWTWEGGSKLAGAYGVYLTSSAPSTGGTPGARYGATSWTDSSGRLWLFGGFGFGHCCAEGALNDLWMYDPSTKIWTWESGLDTNAPGSTYPTKVGEAGTPGGRKYAAGWVDSSGHLWMFGGYDGGTGEYLNDLWMYDPSTSTWFWEGGSTPNTIGTYPSKIGDVGVPGGRQGAVSWVDSSGHLWMFGGEGYDAAGKMMNFFSDLWMYDPSARAWYWEGGSQTENATGNYNSIGGAGIPSGRVFASSWLDSSGKLWLFGGEGVDSSGVIGSLSDLWVFDPSLMTWTWKGGSKLSGFQNGTYPPNIGGSGHPGPRFSAVGWNDNNGHFWLFGGTDVPSSYNDLWMLQP